MGASKSQHSHLCVSSVFIQRRMEGMGRRQCVWGGGDNLAGSVHLPCTRYLKTVTLNPPETLDRVVPGTEAGGHS